MVFPVASSSHEKTRNQTTIPKMLVTGLVGGLVKCLVDLSDTFSWWWYYLWKPTYNTCAGIFGFTLLFLMATFA